MDILQELFYQLQKLQNLTEENGFNSSVRYRADYLNGTGTEKYRNIEVEDLQLKEII